MHTPFEYILLGMIGFLIVIITMRRNRCEQEIERASREAFRLASQQTAEAYKYGYAAGASEAERHYFDWIGKRTLTDHQQK